MHEILKSLQAVTDQAGIITIEPADSDDFAEELIIVLADGRRVFVSRMDEGPDTYSLHVWERLPDNDWIIRATSYRIYRRFVRPDEIGEVLLEVIRQATEKPMTARQSAALLNDRWYVRLLRSLKLVA